MSRKLSKVKLVGEGKMLPKLCLVLSFCGKERNAHRFIEIESVFFVFFRTLHGEFHAFQPPSSINSSFSLFIFYFFNSIFTACHFVYFEFKIHKNTV